MGYFFPGIELSVRLKILSIWIAAPAMNASSTELHREIRRAAGRARRRRNAVPRRPKMLPKRGGRRRKIWKTSKDVWKPCNTLKSHKTAKDLFGKAWSETRDFWRSLEKGLEGAFIPPPLAPSHQRPPIERDRHCEERSDEATRGSASRDPLGCFAALVVRPRKSSLSIRKSGRPVSSKGTGRRTAPNSQ